MKRGLICYPMGGTIDGVRGDHVLLAPPFIIEGVHIEELAEKLGDFRGCRFGIRLIRLMSRERFFGVLRFGMVVTVYASVTCGKSVVIGGGTPFKYHCGFFWHAVRGSQ